MRQYKQRLLAALLTGSLALTGIGGTLTAQAEGSMWNPMNWFSGSDATAKKEKAEAEARAAESRARLEEARKRAEEAQKLAEEALLNASRAQQEAAKAQEEATMNEARLNNARRKPTVTFREDAPKTRATEEEAPTRATTEIFSTPAVMEARTETTTTTETTEAVTGDATDNPDAEANTTTFRQPLDPMRSLLDVSGATQRPAAQTTVTETATTTTEMKTESGGGLGRALNPMKWFGGGNDSQSARTASSAPASTTGAKEIAAEEAPAPKNLNAAVIETQKGNITIELLEKDAPETVANFRKLVDQGFYNKFNMKFHRVIPNFVIQTGDPTGTGAGGSAQRIPLEVHNKLSHDAKGMVAMARGPDPDSATSQFYITLSPQKSLDGKYAIFGRVIAGMDVLDKIEKQDMLYGVKLVDLDTVVRDPAPEKKGLFSKIF